METTADNTRHLRGVQPTPHDSVQPPKPFDDRHLLRDGWKLTHRHKYLGRDNTVLFEKLRYQCVDASEPKGYRKVCYFRHRNGKHWYWGIGCDERPLYCLQTILASDPNEPIFVLESEKVADRLTNEFNLVATCSPTGSWKNTDLESLRDRRVFVLLDHNEDGVGDKKGAEAAGAICGVANSVRMVHSNGPPDGSNIADAIGEGFSVTDFIDACEQSPPYLATPRFGAWQFHDESPAPPTAWLIKHLLPKTGAGLVSGQWGTFKTTMALDLSVSVMAGPPFAGRFTVKRRGGVAYFAPEGSGGLKSRLDAIAREQGVTGALPFAWRSDCPSLMAPDALDQLVRMAEETAKHFKQRFGVELALIFIDTMIAAAGYSRVGDDNDAAVGQALMSRLSDLSRRTGALVVGLDHFGKVVETGTRGSSSKEGHADVVLALLGDRQINGTITNLRLAIRKMRDGVSGLEIPFTPKDVAIGTDEDGEPMTRKVLDWGKQESTPTDSWSGSLRLLRRILMTVLTDAGIDIVPFADGPTVRALDKELIRAEFYKQYSADGDAEQKAQTRRKAFGRTIRQAQDKSLIVVREIDGVELVWLAKKEEAPL